MLKEIVKNLRLIIFQIETPGIVVDLSEIERLLNGCLKLIKGGDKVNDQ